MLKHCTFPFLLVGRRQPPSGGCVLKPLQPCQATHFVCQPPSGGCVLKQALGAEYKISLDQPPSGGCVLKHNNPKNNAFSPQPAAFRRLCVETLKYKA